MKNLRLLLIIAVCVFCLSAFFACKTDTPPPPPDGGTTPTPERDVKITAVTGTVIRDTEISVYDFTRLFTVTSDGGAVSVLSEWIDSSDVKEEPGSYYVTCTYGGKQAIAIITVRSVVYEIKLSAPSVSIKQEQVAAFSPLDFFSATEDGVPMTLTADMFVSDLSREVGGYTCTLTLGSASETLRIEVMPDHLLEVIPAYRELSLTAEETSGYDFTTLFTLYADGLPVRVTEDMIDTSALRAPELGKSYDIIFSYKMGNTSCRQTITITVCEEEETIVTARSVVTYPNSPVIDLTTLFEVKKGDKSLTVTPDMIEGTVDYNGTGIYEITLSYPGCAPAVATVEIRAGVVILAPETVTVRRGTDKSLYDFSSDFTVIVNGIRFCDFTSGALDVSAVSFDRSGDGGVATLTIRYNKDPLTGLAGKANYTDYTATIRYLVTENTYTATVISDSVLLPAGTGSYDISGNLRVSINGINQTFTTNPEYADPLSCYVRLLSSPVDFSSAATQRIRIAVYVNGPENDPIEISYDLRIESGVKISASGAWVFAGYPLSIRDLFTISDNGESVTVTYEMLHGRVDIFTPGVYSVTVIYRGIEKTASVVVFDAGILGTYETRLTTIGSEDETDEDGYVTPGNAKVILPDLTISADGKAVSGGDTYEIVGGLDGHTLILKKAQNTYTLHYSDGIIVLDPDNSVKLGFNDAKRPLVYFSTDMWDVKARVTVNYSSQYVLASTNTSYSIDTFRIESKDGTRTMWYALRVRLAEKTSADTVYVVGWGAAEYPEDFTPGAGVVSSLLFDGESYSFTMSSRTEAKVNRQDNSRPWANRRFTGTLGGDEAVLVTDQYENYTLTVGGKVIFRLNLTSDMAAMKNGGVNYAAGILFVYSEGSSEGDPYSYRFIIDTEAGTFTALERDPLFGVYTLGNITLFLDGYGTGYISFDKTSYKQTLLTYTEKDNRLTVRYRDTLPGFAYGDGAELWVSPLLNLLTVSEMPGTDNAGRIFENTYITNGAIVEISNAQIGAGASARDELLGNIRIITPDGELTGADKTAVINLKSVKFSAEGYYEFTVTVPVLGEAVTCRYAVAIIPAICEGKPISAVWGQGTLSSGYSLTIDDWGKVTLRNSGTVYYGLAAVGDDGTAFTARVRSGTDSLLLSGRIISDGLLRVGITGGVNVTDYFTTGACRITGKTGMYLRAYTVGGSTSCFLASALTGEGSSAVVSVLSGDLFTAGAIISVTTGDDTVILRVNGWADTRTGLTQSDRWRGEYRTAAGDFLTLDGFGSAVYGGLRGEYRMNGELAVLTTDRLRAFRIDTVSLTCEEVTVVLNIQSFAGRSYTAEYSYVCSNYTYTATTVITFGDDGKVRITSVSPSHDSSSDGCEEDSYQPPFTCSYSVGRYTVSGDRLTIDTGSYKITFMITDVTGLTALVCTETDLPTGVQGYFGAGTIFPAG